MNEDTPKTSDESKLRSGKRRLSTEEIKDLKALKKEFLALSKQIKEQELTEKAEKEKTPITQPIQNPILDRNIIFRKSTLIKKTPPVTTSTKNIPSKNLPSTSCLPSKSGNESYPESETEAITILDTDSDSIYEELQNTSLDTLNKDPETTKFLQSLNPINNKKMALEFPSNNFYKSIPEFSGDEKEVQRFISCCNFFYNTLTEAHKAIFFQALVRKLSDKAFDFYNNRKWINWPEFRDNLKKYFSIQKSFESYQVELANIKQRRLKVKEYSQKVESILYDMNKIGKDIKVENVSGEKYFKVQNEKLATKAFINGLNEPMKTIVKARKYNKLENAINDAIELELDEEINSSQRNQNQVICNYCNNKGHTIDQCFKKKNGNNFNMQRLNNNFKRMSFNNNNNYQNFNRNNNYNPFRPNNNNFNSNYNNNRNNMNYRNNTNYRNNNYQNNNNVGTGRNTFFNRNSYNANNNNNNNNERNGQRYNNRPNTNGNYNGNRNENKVRVVDTTDDDSKNEHTQTAQEDNACLNFLLN